jgi:uncharacterized protein with HEPN domain
MQRDILLLSEMVDAAEQAQRLVVGLSAAELGADRMRRDSLLWNFTVLGEAATSVSRSCTRPRSSSSASSSDYSAMRWPLFDRTREPIPETTFATRSARRRLVDW